ncbi:hypothetical protein NIBR502772_18575 [Pseudarthrobacter sp. NIBRBAC000502772]|nr:hypothetical protein NIBR502772_18575 [Pseudarthrobacter sp. NIBRBAC000502772]
MVAVAHTKRGEQSTADAASHYLPLVRAAASRAVDTTADAFKVGIDGKPSTTGASLSPRKGSGPERNDQMVCAGRLNQPAAEGWPRFPEGRR